jgi:hypothetical protein
MEPKFRKIGKNKEALQKKIFAFPNAVGYLKVVGFKETSTDLELSHFDQDHLRETLEALTEFIRTLGGKTGKEFDPYASSFSSSTGEKALTDVLGVQKKDFKHVKMSEEMD